LLDQDHDEEEEDEEQLPPFIPPTAVSLSGGTGASGGAGLASPPCLCRGVAHVFAASAPGK
jgi:hypothetical protein